MGPEAWFASDPRNSGLFPMAHSSLAGFSNNVIPKAGNPIRARRRSGLLGFIDATSNTGCRYAVCTNEIVATTNIPAARLIGFIFTPVGDVSRTVSEYILAHGESVKPLR
jgi:hypothetical protein